MSSALSRPTISRDIQELAPTEVLTKILGSPRGVHTSLTGMPRPASFGYGNIDLTRQPVVNNPDGTTSTVDSMSFNQDGREILIPRVTPDGRHLSEDDAINEYRKTGKYLGMFSSPEDATKYAEQLHNDYASGLYGRDFSPRQSTVGFGQIPIFEQDAPQVTSRTATAKGAPPLLAFLADFATSFGSGPQAAQNQQMMRSRGIEDFFTREQESADMRSGQVQQGFNLRQRDIQNNENNALKLIIEGLRADTRKDVAATTQAGQKARTEIQEEGRNTRTSATLKSREQIAVDNRAAAKERIMAMISAARNRQASSLAHSSIMQNERLSQQERLNLGAKITPLRAMEGQFADVLAAFEAAEGEVSPSGSALGNIQLKTGGLLGTPSKNFSALSTQLAQLKNELLKIRSGAAVVDQEFRRIANELPTLGGGENARWLGDNAEQFRQKLELGMADVQRNISIWGQVAGNAPQKPQGEQKKVTINWNDLPK